MNLIPDLNRVQTALSFIILIGIILEFDDRPENIAVISSRPAHFQCSVHASPTSIVWQYQSNDNSPAQINIVGDETGPVSSKYSITVGLRSSMLTIHNVTWSDQGIYICVVTAGRQSINASAQLGIIGKQWPFL